MLRPLDPRLLRAARAARLFLVAAVLLGAATAGLAIAQAVVLAGLLTTGELGGLWLLALIVAARAAAVWGQEAAALRASQAVKSTLRTALLRRVLELGPSWLTGERSGELTTLATRGLDALDEYFARYLPQLALALVVPVAVLVALLGADWPSAATVALTLPLIPLFMVLIGLYTQARVDRQWRLLGRLGGHFLDVVAGLPTLRVFGRAKAQARAVGEVTDQYRSATMSTLRIAFLSSVALELLATLSVALVAVSVGLRLAGGSLDLRTALIVLLLTPEAYLPLRAVGANFHASAEGLAAADRVFDVLATAPAVPALARGPVSLDGVRVTYPGRDTPALDGFWLDLAPGETVALTGPSGCGKSTVLAVLLGFVPAAGRVCGPARERISWAPQRPHLFAGTVAANLRLGAPAASDAEVRAAAALVGIDGLLDRDLGEDGAGVSEGQRQRIGLARALLREADLLLLDEPTSHLDNDSEAAVARVLSADRRTTLITTHRPALLAAADRVVRL